MTYLIRHTLLTRVVLTSVLFALSLIHGSKWFGISALFIILIAYSFSLSKIRSASAQFCFIFLALFILSFVSIDLSVINSDINYLFLSLLLFIPLLAFGIPNKMLLAIFFLLSLIPLLTGHASIAILPRLFMICAIFGAISVLKFSEFQKTQIYFIQATAILSLVNLVLFFSGAYNYFSEEFGLAVPRMFLNWGGLNPNRSAILFGTSFLMYLELPKTLRRNLRIPILLIIIGLLCARSRNITAVLVLIGSYRALKVYGIKAAALILLLLPLFYSEIYIWFLREQDSARIAELSSRALIWSEILGNFHLNAELFFGNGAYSSNRFWDGIPFDVSHAHSNYLQIVVESGIVGLMLFLIFFLSRFGQLNKSGIDFGEKNILLMLLVACITEPHINGVVSVGTYVLIFVTRRPLRLPVNVE